MPANTAETMTSDQETSLIEANTRALLQLQTTLSGMKDCTYTQCPCEGFSPIGGHVRHVIEFYQEFFTAEKEGFEKGLSYDKRQRNLTLETSRENAVTQIREIIKRFENVQESNQPIAMSMTIDPENIKLCDMVTTPTRELFHLLDHATHHMALIKMTAERLGNECGESFGTAGATLAHNKTKDTTAASHQMEHKPKGRLND